MAGAGGTPLGIGPAGSGFGTPPFRVLSARSFTLNSVDVTFSEPPRQFDRANIRDGLFAGGWSLEPIDPYNAHDRLPQYVESTADLYTLRVFWDGNLDGRAVYDVRCSVDLLSQGNNLIDPNSRVARFTALPHPRLIDPTPTLSAFSDIANPQGGLGQDLA